MKKSITLLLSATLLITAMPITNVNSYADTKPKVTQTKPQAKPSNKEIIAQQDKILIGYLDCLTECDSILLDMYLYGEIGEGTYDVFTEYTGEMNRVIKNWRKVLKGGTPIPTKDFNTLVELMDDLAEMLRELTR